MSSDVKVFKLVSGEEIVTKTSNFSEDGHITIEKPRVMMLTQVPGTTQVSVHMMPFCVGSPDGTLILEQSKIVATLKNIPAELEKAYIQNTSSIELVQ